LNLDSLPSITIKMTWFYILGPLGVASNVIYAGMRAQDLPGNYTKRKIAFVIGFPTSIMTYLVVEEGSCKAYGVELPRICDKLWKEEPEHLVEDKKE
jgi:hypothetical protein